MICPSCKGKGRWRDYEGEAEDCRVCHGAGVVEAFVCCNPEADWITDMETTRETAASD